MIIVKIMHVRTETALRMADSSRHARVLTQTQTHIVLSLLARSLALSLHLPNMYACTYGRMYRYTRGVVISNNEMHRIGDTGVVVVGDLKYDTKTPWIHVDGNYPVGTVVENNFIHELGVFTKQTAGFFQALAAQSTVRSNIIINGPRSAINFNDAAFVRRIAVLAGASAELPRK